VGVLNWPHPQGPLFLLKWGSPFKASNLEHCILLIDRPDLASAAMSSKVKEALRKSGSAELPATQGELPSSSPTRKRMWRGRIDHHPWKTSQ